MSTEPVTSATGIPSARIRASRSCVCSPPRCTSRSTTSGRSVAIAASASATVAASATANPSSSRFTRQSMRSAGSSSTISALTRGCSCIGRECRASIRIVAPRTGTQELYAVQVGQLWSWLSPTLTHVDEPFDVRSLRRLQYALHVASEHAYGLEPPEGAATAHAELADALACARDVTGELAEGDPMLEEWRGALLRVRLARMRLATPAPPAALELPP